MFVGCFVFGLFSFKLKVNLLENKEHDVNLCEFMTFNKTKMFIQDFKVLFDHLNAILGNPALNHKEIDMKHPYS